MENLVNIIIVLWALAMVWFIHEIVWGVRRMRYARMLRKLPNDQLETLYREQWLKINAEVVKNRFKRMRYVAILMEMIRRDLYLGRVVN